MPTISVIVPVYKVEPYLTRCVDSILGQTYRDFELILVDDGSPDSCGAMCDAYAEKDSRIHVIHQENGGLSAARNAGLDWVFANSDSQWITFVDSDDWVHREYLKTMFLAAEQFGVLQVFGDMLSTDVFLNDAKLPEGDIAIAMTSEYAYEKYYGMCMPACGRIIHRSLIENIRFPIGKIHEDAFVTHLLVFACEKIAVCDVPLYYYFGNPNSITRVKWSEKRLNQMEGHEVRLQFLREMGYRGAYISELREYVNAMFLQLEDLRLLGKRDASYRQYRKALYPKAMAAFKEARSCGLFPYSEKTVWIYELAYPIKPVWLLRNLIKRYL